MNVNGVEFSEEALADFCRRHGIRKLSFFGSILRSDFRPDSDVDVLVEFQEGVRLGLMRLARMEKELSRILGRSAEVYRAEDLSRYFRDEVVQEARVQYG